MKSSKKLDIKEDNLKKAGILNPRPKSITDTLFCGDDFFDPRDLIQVKYEMIRRVLVDGKKVAGVAKTFGFSRPSFYEALKAFKAAGLRGLLPAPKGPQRAHKLSKEVMSFILETLAKDRTLKIQDLIPMIEKKFGISVHSRSIERGIARVKKKQL
jgi:transposase